MNRRAKLEVSSLS